MAMLTTLAPTPATIALHTQAQAEAELAICSMINVIVYEAAGVSCTAYFSSYKPTSET